MYSYDLANINSIINLFLKCLPSVMLLLPTAMWECPEVLKYFGETQTQIHLRFSV